MKQRSSSLFWKHGTALQGFLYILTGNAGNVTFVFKCSEFDI